MKEEQPTPAQPVAYDSEGRPLYYQNTVPPIQAASPPTTRVGSRPDAYDGHNFNPKLRTQNAAEQDIVHTTRPVEPTVPEPSADLKQKHDESVRAHPFLNLSPGEFVVLRISRHPIGIILPVFFTSLAVIILTTFLLLVPDFYSAMQTSASFAFPVPSQGLIVLVVLLLILFSALVGGASIWIYQRNQFFLTNESVVQEIQLSLFSHHEQTVSLGSVEDASFKRQGLLQHIFNYGTMRLSTEGEETTYRFSFVENPKDQVAIVSNAVEAFKNGRPVDD